MEILFGIEHTWYMVICYPSGKDGPWVREAYGQGSEPDMSFPDIHSAFDHLDFLVETGVYKAEDLDVIEEKRRVVTRK